MIGPAVSSRRPDDPTWRILQWLGRQQQTPADIDAAQWESARDFARRRYAAARGIEHYRKLFSALGWSDRRRGLDGGSGAGNWTIAFALDHESAIGIDPNEAYVRIATGAAGASNLADRVRYRRGELEALDFPAAAFDAVWSHGVLQYCNAADAVSEISRVCQPGGQFYCGWLTTGFRFYATHQALVERDAARLRAQLEIYLSTALHREGIAQTPYSRVRLVTAPELIAVCGAFGLRFIRQPGLQDNTSRFVGLPHAADILCVRDPGPTPIDAELLALSAVTHETVGRLRELVRLGLGKLVYPRLRQLGMRWNDADFVSLFAMSALGAGCAADVSHLIEEERVDAKVRGLIALAQERFDDAVALFQGLPASGPDRGFLLGAALLLSGSPEAAAVEFERGLNDNKRPVECGMAALLVHLYRSSWEELFQRMAGVLRLLPAEVGASSSGANALADGLLEASA